MDQQHTRTVKSRIRQLMETTYRNHHDTLFEELTTEVQLTTTTHKKSNGKRGIFLALSNANQSH